MDQSIPILWGLWRRLVQCIIKIPRCFWWLLAVTAVFNAGCRRSENADPGTLVVAIGAAPSTLDPRTATDANGMRLVDLLFNSLVKIGPDLKVQGDAASSWT